MFWCGVGFEASLRKSPQGVVVVVMNKMNPMAEALCVSEIESLMAGSHW
jgi:hypothetical protein